MSGQQKLALLLKNMATSIYTMNYLKRLKEQGLCVSCRKPLDRDGVRCISCNEKRRIYENETRHMYAENGICPRCRREKLFGDEKACLECNAKIYEWHRKRVSNEECRLKYNEKQRELQKNIYHKRIELGICTRCGKRKADNGCKTCGICRAKIRETKRRNSKPVMTKEERFEKGLCFWCDNPRKEGYKVCEKHYQMNIEKLDNENVRKARNEIDKRGGFFN